MTTSGDIYAENSLSTDHVDKFTLNSSIGIPVLYTCRWCYDIFVDINDVLYCSIDGQHQVFAKSLKNDSSQLNIVAGTGTMGSLPNMLNRPSGIFVDTNFDLYVADFGNHRIQLFPPGQLTATTVAGNGSLNLTITLNRPNSIVLDADKYLFIADTGNSRIIGSGPNGFRCIIGCSGVNGSLSDQLNNARSFSFDHYGNIFVADFGNRRIQKFILMANSCGK